MTIWPHVDYSIIETDICSYANRHELLQLGVDATNEVSFSERLRSLGLPVKPVRFTMSLKQELVSDVMLFLSQKRLSIPSRGAEELLAQMREQERIISQAGSIRYEHPSGRHDDVFWAFAIMVHLAKPYMLGTLDFRIYPIHR
ncbi:MAG: hypothetical protein HYU39_08535 [Thaumarchaeota archaeon]|nr:hypothetical protein [Nitrososphaerota archaeon]